MELMPNYLLMGMAGCNDGQKKKIILHITLSSDHHGKKKRERKEENRVVPRERQS